MNAKRVDELMKLVDDIATARVQRYVTQLQHPDDDARHARADQRVRILKATLREQLERL